MFRNEGSFVEGLLVEANTDTKKNFIQHFNLPLLLERTLTEYYVDNLEIKQIAYNHRVDERTVKRWKKAALETAEVHFKHSLLCHFNDTSKPLTDRC